MSVAVACELAWSARLKSESFFASEFCARQAAPAVDRMATNREIAEVVNFLRNGKVVMFAPIDYVRSLWRYVAMAIKVPQTGPSWSRQSIHAYCGQVFVSLPPRFSC